MTAALNARQTQILKSLIDEYIATAEPVGSVSLEKKYNLGVSPATIRKEMGNLLKFGYLRQPHTSAGRVPTPLAMKFYINQLMEEKQINLTDEVKAKLKLQNVGHNFEQLMSEATQVLADKTQTLAVGLSDEGNVWRWGYAHLFASPEFSDLQVCRSLFSFLEEGKRLHELFFERLTGLSSIEVLFGEELGWPDFKPIGMVATRFSAARKDGAIGVIGPFRLNYSAIIPMVKYFGNLIQECLEADE